MAVDVYDEPAMNSMLASKSFMVDDAILYLADQDDDRENAAADRLSQFVSGTTVRILTTKWIPSASGGAKR